jgi:hypothetical protein
VQQLGKTDVEAAFHEMGEILYRAKKVAEIAVYGGAAILLQFEAEFRTGDVDALVSSGDHGAVMDAAWQVAERHGWLRSWFSEAVSTYLSGVGEVSLHGAYPSASRAGLRVYVANPDYLLAMKLRAMRVGSRDEVDAVMLARASGITTFDAMISLLTRYFPKEPPDARRMTIVKQFSDSLHASPS